MINLYFYYDPVLGLQYHSAEPDIQIDLAMIPRKFDMKEYLYFLKKQGLAILDYVATNSSIENHSKIITNL